MYALIDCGMVSKKDILDNVVFSWPKPTRISYSFAADLTDAQTKTLFIDGLKATMGISEPVKMMLRAGLQQWQQLSGGLIGFVEKPFLSVGEPGIVLSTCGSWLQFIRQNIAGITYFWQSGYDMHRAMVCYPEDYLEQGNAVSNRTLLHELGHAIGSNHYHQLDSVRRTLTQIPGGVHCSVMPYPQLISSAASRCLNGVCEPGFSSQLGPLDKRFVRAVYDPIAVFWRQGSYFSSQLSRLTGLPALSVALLAVFVTTVCAQHVKNRLYNQLKRSPSQSRLDRLSTVLLASAVDMLTVAVLAGLMGATATTSLLVSLSVLVKGLLLAGLMVQQSQRSISHFLARENVAMAVWSMFLLRDKHSFNVGGFQLLLPLVAVGAGLLGGVCADVLEAYLKRTEKSSSLLPQYRVPIQSNGFSHC